jgi:desulfoferrodoxin (superoxide reductase-like protein)
MDPDHYITSVNVVNVRDPVPLKGSFHLTPANGQVYLAFQARLDQGVSKVLATAECNVHGRSEATRSIDIPSGAGGCAAPAPPLGRSSGDEILPPRIRIPVMVERGWIRRDEIIHIQLKMRHPSRTGLIRRDGEFVQESEPFYLKDMEVFYGNERVSRFALTPALSDDPFITFKLRASREGPLRVLVTNNRGQRFEAMQQIRLS